MNVQFKRRVLNPLAVIIISVLFGGLAILARPVETQAADIAKGGSAIEVAVPITAGKYTGLPLAQNEQTFYKITVKAGQELKVAGSFKPETMSYGGTSNTIRLYNENRQEQAYEFEGTGGVTNVVSAVTLADSEKPSQTYYIEISDDSWGTASGELDVTLTDRYDAESTTDAGQTIDTTMTIKPGSHKGYMSQIDTDDYYSIPAAAGKFAVKVTPNGKMMPTVEIYDQNRTLLAEQTSTNPGQIFTLSADIVKTENIYLHFHCDINTGCANAALDYTFVTSTTSSGDIASTDTTPTTTAKANNNAATNNNTWIGLAVLAVIIVAIVVAVIVANRKKKPSATPAASSDTPKDKDDEVTPVETKTPPSDQPKDK